MVVVPGLYGRVVTARLVLRRLVAIREDSEARGGRRVETTICLELMGGNAVSKQASAAAGSEVEESAMRLWAESLRVVLVLAPDMSGVGL